MLFLHAKVHPRLYLSTSYYVDAGFHPIAVIGTRLYQLARLVPASTRMDVEGADSCLDDGGVPANVRRHLALYRPYAHAFGNRRLRSRHIEHLHIALPLYDVLGA